jgi:hypothetical protein
MSDAEAGNDNDTSSILLYRARDVIEGSLLEAMLEENGVEARTSAGHAVSAFGELGADAFLVDVRVRSCDALKAKCLVDAFFRDRGSTGTGAWTCTTCGSDNDPGYGACWSCGAERGETTARSGELELGSSHPASATQWTGWDVPYLAYSLAGVVGIGCLLLAWVLASLLSPRVEGVWLEEGAMRGALLVTFFLVFWIPPTIYILRWGLAARRPAKKSKETT